MLNSSELPTLPATIYARGYYNFSQLPDAIVSILDPLNIAFTGARLTPTGKLRLYVSNVQIGSDSIETISADQWYRIELAIGLAVGAADTVELRLNGNVVASTTGHNLTDLNMGLANWRFGWSAAGAGINKLVYVDDIAINDSLGSDQNSWPGPGQIVLLRPISDSQVGTWTGGLGGTSNLFDAVNNQPPLGTASQTDTSQIESVDGSGDNSTAEYRANMTTYQDAGIHAGDLITVVQSVVDHGEDTAVGIKTGSTIILSNPMQLVADAFTFGNDSGALGTWPKNWTAKWGQAQYNPSVDVTLSPVLGVRKTDVGVQIASVDAMGIYIEYQDQVPAMQP
jgi:hypothetical protein